MNVVLALLASLVSGVLYGSVIALLAAGVAWPLLRWSERSSVVFNRVYLACLLWTLAGMVLVAGVALHEGRAEPPYGDLLASGLLRGMLVVDMLVGAVLVWRLVPRVDARRIRPASACIAVAAVMAIAFGLVTSLA